MRLASECYPYLLGEKFSSKLHVKFDYEKDDWEHVSRIDVLTQLCIGKKVIHVGCVNHDIATINKKLKHNNWLHKILCDNTQRCYGVDINEEGIRYIKENLGYQDVEAVDIMRGASEALLNNHWDYILIPEVLEHTNNPVDFLKKLHEKFKSNVEEMIVTVPNAFSKRNFKNSKKGIEKINSDHRYWFTPYTLSKVVISAGLRIKKIIMCKHGSVKKRISIKDYSIRKHPLIRNDIVMIAGF